MNQQDVENLILDFNDVKRLKLIDLNFNTKIAEVELEYEDLIREIKCKFEWDYRPSEKRTWEYPGSDEELIIYLDLPTNRKDLTELVNNESALDWFYSHNNFMDSYEDYLDGF